MTYYSEFDPFAADWLRALIAEGLIPQGEVDARDIKDVTADELRRFDSVHLFAGVGGWPLAIRLAGWPDDRPVWTGSCPCQPYSSAGKQKGDADERNLWPEMFRLVRECRPQCVIGEQVPNAIGHGWLDGICDDLEGEGYACGAVVLPACSVGAPILRQRLFWCAEELAGAEERRRGMRSRADGRNGAESSDGCSSLALARPGSSPSRIDDAGESAGPDQQRSEAADELGRRGRSRGVAQSDGPLVRGLAPAGKQSVHERGPQPDAVERTAGDGRDERWAESNGRGVAGRRRADGPALGRTVSAGPQGHSGDGDNGHEPGRLDAPSDGPTAPAGAWADFRVIRCLDGADRRISAERGDEPLAHGVPRDVGPLLAELERMGLDRKTAQRVRRAASRLLAGARRNRVGRLRGYGNAIVPQAAAVFVRAVMGTL